MPDDLRWGWCNNNRMWCTWIILKPSPRPCSMEKLSPMKPVPGVRKVGDCCFKPPGLLYSVTAALCVCVCESLNCVWLFATPWTVAQGILQARVLKWVVISSSKGSSKPRDWTQVFRIAGGFFPVWATREVYCSLRKIQMRLVSWNPGSWGGRSQDLELKLGSGVGARKGSGEGSPHEAYLVLPRGEQGEQQSNMWAAL